MKKLLQNLRGGDIYLSEMPEPHNKENEYLIKTTKSLISTGTEKMLLDFGKSDLLNKALKQPEKVRMTLEKIKTDGLLPTLEAVFSKLNYPLEMGYCNVGVVENSCVNGYKKGTRVISNGSHASHVVVSKNLVHKIPENVCDETAAFTIPASIAMQGIRLIKPEIGESVVVVGLGLIGLLAVQILLANGCKVYGVDLDPEKCKIAKSYGAYTFGPEEYFREIIPLNGGECDAVLITASTNSNQVIKDAANVLRKKGKIVLIGVVGLNLDRSDFYEKEISFQVSCSYGPGRYEVNYEQKSMDYPIEYVRWTENRNFESVLELMSKEKIVTNELISSKFDFHEAKQAYEKILSKNVLGVMLEYGDEKNVKTIQLNPKKYNLAKRNLVSFVGSGNYASRTLLPAFKKSNFQPVTLVSKTGISSKIQGDKFGFEKISTDFSEVLNDKSNIVVLATRHSMHASQVQQVLKSKKDVFVEKPLAVNLRELSQIQNTYDQAQNRLMVGFNRRFSPHSKKIKELLSKKNSPKSFLFTMNSGFIPQDHWTQDSEEGGRIIGEACHYIDLLLYLSGEKIRGINVVGLGNSEKKDTASITIELSGGSIGVINYFSNGAKAYKKERIEVFCDGGILRIDNFKNTVGFNWPGFNRFSTSIIDKGQNAMVKSISESLVSGQDFELCFDDIFEVSKASIIASEML